MNYPQKVVITTVENVISDNKCPFHNTTGGGKSNRVCWPNQLCLEILRQHASRFNPMEEHFNYAEAFKSLDLDAVKQDLNALVTGSQEWWPADYGNY